jgi:thioredoxin-like negative regulator of GroEL
MTEAPWASTGLEVLRTEDFTDARLGRPGTFVVCFGAAWCPYARRFVPKFAARRSALPGTLAIADITDLSSPLWETFRIRVTPSVVVFHEGVEVARLDGRRLLGITESAMAKFERQLASGPSSPG